MDFVPLERGATGPEMVRGINGVHECLEGHKKETNRRFDDLDTKVALVLLALGIDPEQPDATTPAKSVLTMTSRQLTLRIVAGVGAGVAFLEAWRWAGRLLPSAWLALTHLNHLIVGN